MESVGGGFSGGQEYYPNKHLYFSQTTHGDSDISTYYKYTGKKMKVLAEKEGRMDINVLTGKPKSTNKELTFKPYKYTIKGKQVSAKKYNAYIKKLLSDAKEVNLKWYKNTSENRKKLLYETEKNTTTKSNKKYYVKKQYINDLGKKFKVLKKNYDWTLTNGEFGRAARCSYQVPGKKIYYTFQCDALAETWEMTNDTKCDAISLKAKTLIKDFNGKIKLDTFVSRLDSDGRKATWTWGLEAWLPAAWIDFYYKGQKYRLCINKESEDDYWISANESISLYKA